MDNENMNLNQENGEFEEINSNAENNGQSVTSDEPVISEEPVIPNSEPTVTFETVSKPIENNSNTGIKVFFSMIAVIVSLIIAVTAGYILGFKEDTSPKFDASTPVADKNTAMYESSKATVFDNVNPSVVGITAYSNDGVGYASGVIYTADGYIVTNDHIYSEIPSAKFLVTLYDGKTYPADFVAGDARSDLAVLKISADNLKKATFGSYSEVVQGEEVIAIGYPQGIPSKSIVTSGTISSTGIRISSTTSYSMKMIQTDTPINEGNSGGALVNMYSQVIGIPSVKIVDSKADNIGFAIPSDTVVKVVDSLIKNGYVEDRGRLGITYQAIDSVYSEIQGMPAGLLVNSITEDSDLNGKGIQKGDIITHINNVEITSSNVALDIIESVKLDEALSFTVYHSSNKSVTTVYASLLPDKGNSSYTNKVTEGGQGNGDSQFGGSFDDFFSDH